jgi:hypothetical protein
VVVRAVAELPRDAQVPRYPPKKGHGVLAAEDADVGVTGDAVGIPASRVVSVGAVAPWSAWCRPGGRGRGCRRRHGGGRPRAREGSAGV